jgi:hypothetical protein
MKCTAVLLLIGSLAACQGDVELGVVAGLDACQRCNMVIYNVNQACGYIEDGELVVFDAPVCLLGSYEEFRARGMPAPSQVYFADNRDGKWNPAESTTFLFTELIPTVMEAGVVCFGSSEAAETARQHPDEIVTDWTGYQTARGTPTVIAIVVFGADGMFPEMIEVQKGDLVLWKVKSTQLEDDLLISITGYDEVGSVAIPASGEEVSFRLLAIRPGSGFPVVNAQSGEALGRMRVSGAHTLDEEEM